MRDGFDLLGALQHGGLDIAAEVPRCSRARCDADAEWRLEWRNPRIHDESRRKVWLACPAHVDYLRDFLEQRDFPVVLQSVSADGDDDRRPEGSAA